MIKYLAHMFVLITAVVSAGCTMANVDPPPLSGPSELSLSLTVTANPDTISLDIARRLAATLGCSLATDERKAIVNLPRLLVTSDRADIAG